MCDRYEQNLTAPLPRKCVDRFPFFHRGEEPWCGNTLRDRQDGKICRSITTPRQTRDKLRIAAGNTQVPVYVSFENIGLEGEHLLFLLQAARPLKIEGKV